MTLTSNPPVQLTDHVWMYPPAADKALVQPSIGVICSATQTVLYDAGNSPAHARRLLDSLQSMHAPPVRYVVYSHHHWDHIFGAQVYVDAYPGVQIVAHRTCYQRTVDYAARGWGREYVRRVAQEKPPLKAMYEMLDHLIEWESFRIVVPDLIFDDTTLTLSLDGLTLEIEHVGGEHADDSTVLRVLEDRVLFMADSFYPKPLTRGARSDQVMVQRFLSEKQAVYVDGHNGRIWRGA